MDHVLQTFRKERKARCSGRSPSRNTMRHARKKARRATLWRSKSAKRCRASSHLCDRRNRYLQSIHCEFKILIILKHCYLMFCHYGKIKRIFQNYTRQTGASGNISPMNKEIIDVFSAFKHVEADIVGSSSGSGILNSGKKITATKLLLFVISTSGAQ